MDYSAYEDRGPGDNLLAQIAATAKHQQELETEVEQMEAALKVKKAELLTIACRTLPDLMEAAGMDEFKLRDGAKVAIKEDIRANISKERAPAACAWLRDHGYGALIKNQVIAEFGRGEDEQAREALALLQERHRLVHQAETVNHQTLGAWVREKMANDPDANLPVDLLGITRQRIAQIK